MVLNPATPVESIQHYLHLLDKVTVMTVDPCYAGQPFIPEMLAKITQLHQLKETGSLRSCWKSMAPVTATPTARCWAPAHRY